MAETPGEILIFNQARMGDLLECIPLLEKIKRIHPRSRVTLAILPGFEKIASRLPGVDTLLSFDEAGLRSSLRESADWIDALSILEKHLAGFAPVRFDEAYNLVYSNSGALILRALGINRVYGLKFESDGFFSLSDPWVAYLWNFMNFLEYNPYNITDIYRHIGQRDMEKSRYSLGKPEPDARGVPEKFGIAAGRPFIAWQPGCNAPDRRVDSGVLAEAARLAAARLSVPVLVVGAPQEAAIVGEMAGRIGPGGLPGICDLDELSVLIARCSLFVTNDTGPMHLAAAVGAPILLLSSGCSNPKVSGPYLEGSFALCPALPCQPCRPQSICRDLPCRTALSPSAIAETVCWVFQGRGTVESPPRLDDARLYTFKRDAWDFLRVFPVPLRDITLDEWFTELWHLFWNSLTAPDPQAVLFDPFLAGLQDHYSFAGNADLAGNTLVFREQAGDWSRTLLSAHEALQQELDLLQRNPQRLRERMPAIKEILGRLDNETDRISRACPFLSPHRRMFGHQKDNIHIPDPLASLAALSAQCRLYGETLARTADWAGRALRVLLTTNP